MSRTQSTLEGKIVDENNAGGTCPLCKQDYPSNLARHLPSCPERDSVGGHA